MSDCEVQKMQDILSEPLPGSDDELIVVCDNCLMASCWHGYFMCDKSDIAGTVEKTRGELKSLGKEHPDYITNEPKPLW